MISIASSFGSISNSMFSNLVAKEGPAITAMAMKFNKDESNLTVINSTFADNTAFHGGGAIFISEIDYLTVRSSKFLRNSAISNSGGAIFLSCSLVDNDSKSYR